MKGWKIRPFVFLVPILLLAAGLGLSLTVGDSFASVLESINSALLSKFGWLYSLTTLIVLLISLAVMVLPFGSVRIGGKNAKAELKGKDVFAIVLCSIVGIGMVTWGTAEIMAHYSSPPVSTGIAPYSDEAANFAMETVFLHWTFPAYGLYALPSLMFAFAFYNMKCPFSVSSFLYPLVGEKMTSKKEALVDIVCVFSLLCGMVGTIGTTILTVLGGISYLTEGRIQKGAFAIGVIILILVGTFIISSITGVMKGIRFLSNTNLYIFIGLAAFVLVFGPTFFIFNFGTEGVGNFLQSFFSSMLRTNAISGDDWSYWWSIFYWAAYMAWAPVSGMFIGRVCYGQTVRKVIMLTLVGPSLFTGIWMAIFSGTSMYFERAGYGIAEAYNRGYEYTAYAVFEHLPLTLLITIIFLFVAALSVVTASDSSTSALANLVSKDISAENPESKSWVKIVFGVVIAVVTFIIITYSDISGIKMISNIGAFPALWIELLIAAGIIKIARNPQKYDKNKDDYDEKGRYR